MKYEDDIAQPIKRLVIVSMDGGVTVDVNSNVSIRCPKCLKWKMLADFGIRYMKPQKEHRNQPYCKACR